ncbi:MAG: hypothetical protein KKE62_00375 [Proteobacteria bacterium]|nr:hypothetical protein [Pseudomonadota bacterium]MBU1389454.1 hypothetical protein [Pseudomonadota bacterium]MBU1541274.1 hypothetical protein [Pseudomonadota bacterium]MBU2480096.1 hypothetical protein [Pseudomonadota bacterium]
MISSTAPAAAYEGIETYYTRYDIKSSKNQIVTDNLLMTPAKNDFRAEKFSQIFITGVISATSEESGVSTRERIRNDSLKRILVKNGLKSVKTKDLDTVISYEGIIITPVNVIEQRYDNARNNYIYKVQIEFSPVAFPDRWETLHMKYKIKRIFSDFLDLFRE